MRLFARLLWITLCITLITGCGDDDERSPTSDLTELQEKLDAVQAELDTIKNAKDEVKPTINPRANPEPPIITKLPPRVEDGIPEPPPLPEVVDKVPVVLVEGDGIIVYGHRRNIHIINPDGTDDTFVTHGEQPELSPDRRFIVYRDTHLTFLDNGDDIENQRISITSIDGAQTFHLTDPDDIEAHHRDPTWSRDGTLIAYNHFTEGLVIVNSDGTNRRLVTDNSGVSFSWSPDNRQIAFESFRDNGRNRTEKDQIYTINIDGTDRRQLTDLSSYNEKPDWSPDGRRIVFMSHRDKNWNLYIIDVNTGFETQVTDKFGSDMFPAWSPDGRRIAFSSNRQQGRNLYTVNADGTTMKQLTNHDGGDRIPNWR